MLLIIETLNRTFVHITVLHHLHQWELTNYGPCCFKVQGQIYHKTAPLYPLERQERPFAQLYVSNITQAVV